MSDKVDKEILEHALFSLQRNVNRTRQELEAIERRVKVLLKLIDNMPEDLQWELTKQTNGAMQSPNTDPPN